MTSRLVGRTFASTLTIVWVTAHVGIARADCANDAQCKGDRICEKGVCVSPPPKAPAPVVAPTPPAAPPPAGAPAPPATPPGTSMQQPASPSTGTRVVFEGTNDFVRAEGENGAHGECHMPCSLTLPAGWYTVRAGGNSEQIDVGNRSSMVKVSKGCMACYLTGALNLTLSIPFFVGAGVLLDSSSTEEEGYALAAAGGVVAASGLALLIVGAAVGGGKIVQDDYGAVQQRPSRLAATPSGLSYAF